MTALRVVDEPRDAESNHADWWSAEPGDMWRCTWPNHVIQGRPACWVVRLPDKAWVWHTNDTSTGGGGFWVVTGEPPKITVSPSINVGPEIWHGHIKNGEMTP